MVLYVYTVVMNIMIIPRFEFMLNLVQTISGPMDLSTQYASIITTINALKTEDVMRTAVATLDASIQKNWKDFYTVSEQLEGLLYS